VSSVATSTTVSSAKQAPGPPGTVGLANVRALERDPLATLLAWRARYGDVVAMRLFGLHGMLVAHPDGVRHVVQERHTIYTKQNTDYRLLARVLGKGLVTNDGESWRQQRRLIQPAFHKQRIEGFASLMTREAGRSAERLAAAAAHGQVVDIVAEARRTTLDIVVEALFGLTAGDDAARIAATFTHLNELITEQFTSVLGRAPWIPTRGNLALRRGKRAMDAMVDEIIARRRRAGSGGDDLLGMLLAARDDETGAGMADDQLRDEVTTLLVAGHETTAMALGWTVYLLARHRDQAERVAAEAHAVHGGRPAGLADLEALECMRRVVEESMRLYPPAWVVTRTPSEDDEIDGYRVPKGALVFISPWVTQRHPDYWPEPERFDPDRFAPQAVAQRPRLAHFPFLAGPRMCIGHAFATMELRIILSTWLERFVLPLAEDREIEPEPLVTLRPRGGVPVRPQLRP